MTNKDEFTEMLKSQIDEWSAEIKKMEARAQKVQADARVQYEENLKKMREQRDQAQDKLKELQQASDTAWDDMRKGAESMWAAAEESFTKAWSRFK
jgi:dynactin complex subunit